MVYDLATDLFSHLQRLSLRFHSRQSVGDSIRRVTTDCGCVSIIIKDALLPILASVVTLIAMFVVMWRMEPRLTLVSILVVPWLVFVLRRYMQPMLDRSYEQQESRRADVRSDGADPVGDPGGAGVRPRTGVRPRVQRPAPTRRSTTAVASTEVGAEVQGC